MIKRFLTCFALLGAIVYSSGALEGPVGASLSAQQSDVNPSEIIFATFNGSARNSTTNSSTSRTSKTTSSKTTSSRTAKAIERDYY